MNGAGAFVMVVLILLIIGLALAGFVASQMDNVEQAKAERVYAEAHLVRAQSERSRASAEATGILLAVMMPYAALTVASIFGLALIGLIALLARLSFGTPPAQQIYILPRGAYPGLPEQRIYPALPCGNPQGRQELVTLRGRQEREFRE